MCCDEAEAYRNVDITCHIVLLTIIRNVDITCHIVLLTIILWQRSHVPQICARAYADKRCDSKEHQNPHLSFRETSENLDTASRRVTSVNCPATAALDYTKAYLYVTTPSHATIDA